MHKIVLYVILICSAVYIHSAHGMFGKRKARSAHEMGSALTVEQAQSQKQLSKSVDPEDDPLHRQLRKVLNPSRGYFNHSGDSEEEDNDDEEESDDSPWLLKGTSSRISIAAPILQQHVLKKSVVVALPIVQDAREDDEQPSILELGRKLAALKSMPLDQVQLINVPPDTEVTPRMKTFFMAQLAAADDAVTIDQTDACKPILIIDLEKYFASQVIDLESSLGRQSKSSSPPARMVIALSEDDDEEESQEPQADQAAKSYADRYTLGLKLEWLNKLPLNQIEIVGELGSLQKKELVALLASIAQAVTTDVNDDDGTQKLNIDLSKLKGYKALNPPSSPDAEKMQQAVKPTSQSTDDRMMLPPQPKLWQKLVPLALTGSLCFIVGYLLAKRMDKIE